MTAVDFWIVFFCVFCSGWGLAHWSISRMHWAYPKNQKPPKYPECHFLQSGLDLDTHIKKLCEQKEQARLRRYNSIILSGVLNIEEQ